MIVDAKCGMPLAGKKVQMAQVLFSCSNSSQNFFCSLSNLNPDLRNPPEFDPKDDFLTDPSSSRGAYPVIGSQSGSIDNLPTPLACVPSLRKWEYISREGVQNSPRCTRTVSVWC